LTQDSKATALTRLLFAMKPWYASRPPQLDGLRVASVADPPAVSRAWALQLLLDAPSGGPREAPLAPSWVRAHAPWLARLWGDGVPRCPRLNVNEEAFQWARTDPAGLRAAARAIVEQAPRPDANARRLLAILERHDPMDPPDQRASERLLRGRPEALREAVEILINRAKDLRVLLTRWGYTDPERIGGFLDQDR
jgi:hypothetical protein